MHGQGNEQIQTVRNTQNTADVFSDIQQQGTKPNVNAMDSENTLKVLAANDFHCKMKYLARLKCPRKCLFSSV